MPQVIGVELKVTTPETLVVEFPGVTHYRVGYAALATGLLVPNGFLPMSKKDDNMGKVALVLREGANSADLLLAVTGKIEELVGTREIRLPA